MDWSSLLILFSIVAGFGVIAAAWYAYESRWDRGLFTTEPGKVCANLNAAGARVWLRDHPETQVLDVRSAAEFAGGALPGAVLVPIGDPDFDAGAGALERSLPVLVYCAGGFRSRQAVERLKKLGFENIQHLHRGYLSWKRERRP